MPHSYVSSFEDRNITLPSFSSMKTVNFLYFAGDDLSQEILEILVKMSPTDEETTKFQEYQGDPSLLGPADRFILGLLQVPNAFERLDAMLYKASFEEELQHIQDTIVTLQVMIL